MYPHDRVAFIFSTSVTEGKPESQIPTPAANAQGRLAKRDVDGMSQWLSHHSLVFRRVRSTFVCRVSMALCQWMRGYAKGIMRWRYH